MLCEYNDGTKVKYTGPLQIIKGKDVNVFIKEELIPDGIKSDLDKALFRNSCSEMKQVADEVRKIYGDRACLHELK